MYYFNRDDCHTIDLTKSRIFQMCWLFGVVLPVSCHSRKPLPEAQDVHGGGIRITLTPDGPALAADSPRRVNPGSKIYVSGDLFPTNIAQPEMSVMGRAYDYSQRNSRPIVMNATGRTKADDDGQVSYQFELEVCRKPGIYFLQVTYDDKVVDEMAIEVTTEVD